MAPVKIALIAALSDNGVIGRDNQLPWHLPQDLAHFKRVTLGKPVIMGRKTFESIGRPLPGRPNLVVSRQPDWHAEGVTPCQSLDQALAQAGRLARQSGVAEIMVIGGGDIYRQALPRAQRLYLTRVHAQVAGDAYFPALEQNQWREISHESHGACGSNPYDYSFIVLDRA